MSVMLVLIVQLLALWFDHPILFADTFRQGESFISMEFIRKFLQVPRLRCVRVRARFLMLTLWSLQLPMVKWSSSVAKHIVTATGQQAVLLDVAGKVGDSKETWLCFSVMCVPCAKVLWLAWWSTFATFNNLCLVSSLHLCSNIWTMNIWYVIHELWMFK